MFKNKLQWEDLLFGMRKKVVLRNDLSCISQQIISEFQSILNSDFLGNKCETNWGSHRSLIPYLMYLRILQDCTELRRIYCLCPLASAVTFDTCILLIPVRKKLTNLKFSWPITLKKTLRWFVSVLGAGNLTILSYSHHFHEKNIAFSSKNPTVSHLEDCSMTKK